MQQEEIQTLLSLAWQARVQAKHETAHDLLDSALTLCQETDHLFLGRIERIRGQIYSDLEELTPCYEHYQNALSHYRQTSRHDLILHTERHVADVLVGMEKFGEAEKMYQFVLKQMPKDKGSVSLDRTNTLRAYTVLLVHLSKTKEAIENWKEVRRCYDSLGIKEGVDEAEEYLRKLENE